MSTQRLQVVTPPTPLTSSGSLATATVVLAGQFDNTAQLAPLVDVGLAPVFGTGPTPTPTTVVSLYLVPYVNSTNASTVDTTTPNFPSGSFAGNFLVLTTGTTVYLAVQGLQLSALSYDVYLFNQSGQSITSWTLTFNPTDWQY